MDEDNNNNLPARGSKSSWWKPGQSGNPRGRPRGVASLYSKKLINDFAAHWQTHGRHAIDKVYKENPSFYLRIAVQLVPRELLIQVSKPMENMSDAELAQAAEEERVASMKVIEHIKSRVGEEIVMEATREVFGEDEVEDADGEEIT